MVEPATARFAVGDFRAWHAARETLGGLCALGVKTDAISLLGLRRLFQDEAATKHAAALEVHELAFRLSPDVVCCTPGVLARHLADGLGNGAASLGDALSLWLMPRTAQRIQLLIDDGVLLVWVQVFDVDDERRACTGLLTYCLTGVEVHDLVRLRSGKGNGQGG